MNIPHLTKADIDFITEVLAADLTDYWGTERDSKRQERIIGKLRRARVAATEEVEDPRFAALADNIIATEGRLVQSYLEGRYSVVGNLASRLAHRAGDSSLPGYYKAQRALTRRLEALV